ncbi:hypothetical protein G4Z16_15300 [Streptomyces bathyalis]|uniref:Uncharacterized protein n=1 Tax=Streptomyces bathyalis TaxID=2710756 RepID=A0A7T1T6Z0_9ACTN|nr:hypothetical protein [Streptomyces bathyalis]QPP07528.1 hypothetical protein G4Z16_15300 [Streptomyces bathyalis]
MDLTLRLSDAQQVENLGQLYDWLRTERDLRTCSEVSLVPADGVPGEMSAVFDSVQLVLDSSFQLASLAVGIASWRKACEPRSAVTIIHHDTEIRLETTDLHDAGAVVEALERLRTAPGTNPDARQGQREEGADDGAAEGEADGDGGVGVR